MVKAWESVLLAAISWRSWNQTGILLMINEAATRGEVERGTREAKPDEKPAGHELPHENRHQSLHLVGRHPLMPVGQAL
jgi:hypothetical protein